MDDNQLGALLEDIKSQNEAVLEAVGDMKDKVALIPEMKTDIEGLKDDVKTIKQAVKGTNQDLINLEQRVSDLEAV